MNVSVKRLLVRHVAQPPSILDGGLAHSIKGVRSVLGPIDLNALNLDHLLGYDGQLPVTRGWAA